MDGWSQMIQNTEAVLIVKIAKAAALNALVYLAPLWKLLFILGNVLPRNILTCLKSLGKKTAVIWEMPLLHFINLEKLYHLTVKQLFKNKNYFGQLSIFQDEDASVSLPQGQTMNSQRNLTILQKPHLKL